MHASADPAVMGDPVLEAAAEVLTRAGLGAGQRLCCALSGGVDSVVLFEILRRLQPAFGFQLSAAHVHHGLSPRADAWAQACAARCAIAGVDLQVLRVTVERGHGEGLEAAARTARHAALDGVACDWLVFGHHQDDQAETLLLRLFRGAGVRGAAAMAPIVAARGRRRGRLRPLLALRRAQIVAWAQRKGLCWVEDESNAELHFTRNALRYRVLPVVESLFPAAVPALARASANFAEADALLAELAALDGRACGGMPWRRPRLLALSPARQANLLRWQLRELGGQAPSRARVDEVLRQLHSVAADRPLRVVFGDWVCCAYRAEVWLEAAAVLPALASAWRGEAVLPWGGGAVHFERGIGIGLSLARLEAAQGLRLAPRRAGMKLQLAPNRPRRDLRKLCQEAGIPAWMRDRLPVLWADGEAVWVAGIGVAAGWTCAADEPGVLPRWQAVGQDPGLAPPA
ncbi:tRNA lysidine(34) synthetase TilS [Thauera sp. WH-1]|uniref:tRNA lysidine(34) synthetase TilS n=1 Tax=Thauera sp. WH-1 TaxID=3398230 RepID=UPI0039FD2F1D